MTNFSEMLNKPLADVERPPVPPKGKYEFVCQDVGITERGDFTSVRFMFRGQSVLELDDPDAMAAYGSPTGIMVSKDFLFSKKTDAEASTNNAAAEFRMKNFIEGTLGIEGVSFKEAFALAKGKVIIGDLDHRADKNDPNVVYPNLTSTAPLTA